MIEVLEFITKSWSSFFAICFLALWLALCVALARSNRFNK